MGNYMETSSAEEFTYAEVVYAVYCYLYEFFLIFKELALRSETEKNPSVGTIKYSQTRAGKSFVPVNGMKQMKI